MQQISTFEKERLEKAQIDALGARMMLMRGLVVVGFCFVACPNFFGLGYATARSGNGFVSVDAVQGAAEWFRSIGFLLFGAGLVERVLIRLGK